MAALTEAQIAHKELIDQLDIHHVPKSFRNPSWRPNQRRNKNVKTILGDASRKEVSSMVETPADDSGGSTPAVAVDENGLSHSGTSTPAAGPNQQPNLAQASRSLSKLVLEKTLRGNGNGGAGATSSPSVTYTNIESAPSLERARRYCDITGLPAPYLDPKSRLRYHDKEVFQFIRSLPQGVAEHYLEVRGAHTVLK